MHAKICMLKRLRGRLELCTDEGRNFLILLVDIPKGCVIQRDVFLSLSLIRSGASSGESKIF
jgi:hypothetical protein